MESTSQKQAAQAATRSYWAAVNHGGVEISFNAMPEEVKYRKINGLAPARVLVIGDTAVNEGNALFNPEFPLYNHVFVGGGYSFTEKCMVTPLIIVGTQERLEVCLKALQLALLGPSFQDYKNRFRANRYMWEQLLKESEFMALKDAQGVVIPFEKYVIGIPFDRNGVAALAQGGLELSITHTGTDSYRVDSVGESVSSEVKLEAGLPILPTWLSPTLKGVENHYNFACWALGTHTGFAGAGTTGFLFKAGNQYVLLDAAPFVTQTLMHNGIEPGLVRKVIVSHIHDDHFQDIVRFALNNRGKIELISTHEILECAKVKICALMNISAKYLSHYFLFREVRVDTVRSQKGFPILEPLTINGYEFQLHYGCHAIPSLGVTVRRDDKHLVMISGDTAMFAKLTEMVNAKVVSEERKEFILSLPNPGLSVIDVGSSIIHGTPQDLFRPDRSYDHTEIFGYHTPTLPAEYQRKLNLLSAGDLMVCEQGDNRISDTALITSVLVHMGVADFLHWAEVISGASTSIFKPRETLIIEEGAKEKRYVHLVAHGVAEVLVGDQVVASVGQGELLGEQALLTGQARNATVRSKTPIRLIEIPGNLFSEMILEDERTSKARRVQNGKRQLTAKQRLEFTWQNRMLLADVPAFSKLPGSVKLELFPMLTSFSLNMGEAIVRKGDRTLDAFIIIEGSVEIRLSDGKVIVMGKGEIIGENVPLGITDVRNADVLVREATRILKVPGHVIAQLAAENPRFAVDMDDLTRSRGQSLFQVAASKRSLDALKQVAC